MALDSLRYLPENLRVLRKMFNRVDFYSTCIQRIKTFIKDQPSLDIRNEEHARMVYTLSVEDFAPMKYDYFIDDMKAELAVDSICKLIECTESMIADKWLTTGQYNLMREDLSHIYWEYNRDMEVNGRKSKEQELQEDVLIWAKSDTNKNQIPYWSSVVIITTTDFTIRDSWGHPKSLKTDEYEPEKLYQTFRSVTKVFDKTEKLLNLYRIAPKKRLVQLYLNVLDTSEAGTVKNVLPSIKPKTDDDLAKIADKIYRLKKMWIMNERTESVNEAPENGERLETIKILQSLLPCIDDTGHSKKIEVYQNELKEIEHLVNEYVKSCKPGKQLSLPIVGFGDFTYFEYPNRLKTAISYIEEIPNARLGLQDYLATWERQNSIDLTAMILIYKNQVKQMRDKVAAEILENVGATKEEVKKDPAAIEELRKACLDRLPGETAFYELAHRCFHSDPICISGEIVYKDI